MTNKVTGRCLNIGNCEIANSMSAIEIDESAEFVCTECGKPLVASQAANRGGKQTAQKWLAGIGVVGATAAVIFGLSNTLKPKAPQVANPPSSPPTPSGSKVVLRLAGSNTLGSKLLPALVEAYFKSKGCTDVEQKKIELELINVTCKIDGASYLSSISFKGSSTAFTSLKDGSADVGMASRRAKPAEVASLAGMGNLLSPANEHVIALDGIAIIVSQSNQIPQLSVDQVRGLFAGQFTFFNQVGGISKPVRVYRRDDKSGTFDSFNALVMAGVPITPSAKAYEDSHELSSTVAGDVSGIGFVGHTHIGDARPVPIGTPGQQALLPNRFTIQTEDYPLSRRLYLYSISESSNPEVARFLSFIASKEGQAIVERERFVPLEIVTQRSTLPAGGTNAYQSVVSGAERLSVNFRFNTGSNQLDNRALADLDRVTEFLIRTKTNPSRLALIGFADNIGDPSSNVVLSKERANTVAAALKTRGITPGRITGFGAENPVASNATTEGRERNRRVEVWVTRQE
jgi:phosphate transport system substrate-binding protein